MVRSFMVRLGLENVERITNSFLFVDLCGTPGYLAPETLKCNMFEDAPGYSLEVDM